MFAKQSKSFIIGATGLASILLALGVSAEVNLGAVYQCAHGFRGVFIVKNDREVVISGMNYDGKGPAAWFHGQLRGSKGVYTSDPDKYMTLPYPDKRCGRLEVGRSYKDENVTLYLPVSIKRFQTIGILCYEYCHNFGHIVIPENLNVTAVDPFTVPEYSGCPTPKHDPCSSTNQGEIKPDCKAGVGQLLPNAFGLIGGILAFFALLTNNRN